MPAILCTESKRSSQANSGVFLLLWYHGFAANTTLCRIEAVDWTWITACVPAFSISTTSIGTRLDLQCSRNHFLRWALLKWWSASLDLYPVPSSCKALVGGIRSWRTSFFVVFSFRLGNWLSSVQNLLPYLLYSQVDKGSHNGWGWAEWRTTPKSSQTRRSLAPVPPPWDLLVEPWHGQGWPGQKSWKRWPNVHAVDEPNGIRMLQRPNQIEADAATKLQDIASEVNSPRTTVPNTSR